MTTIPISRDAVEQALEWLESLAIDSGRFYLQVPPIAVLTAALAQADQPAAIRSVWEVRSKTFQMLFTTKSSAVAWQQAAGMATPASFIDPVEVLVFSDSDIEGGADQTVGINGLTESETNASASVMGLTKPEEPKRGGRPMTMREIMEAEEKPEPQAQAGEPTEFEQAVAAVDATLHHAINHWQDRCAKKDAEAAELRAALRACVEALEAAKAGLQWYRDVDPKLVEGSDDEADQIIDAAIIQAQEVLK